MKHEELRNALDHLNNMERGYASQIVTECLKYIMDHIQPERSKREDCDRCNKLKEELNDCCRIEISQMRCSEHCGNTVREVR